MGGKNFGGTFLGYKFREGKNFGPLKSLGFQQLSYLEYFELGVEIH